MGLNSMKAYHIGPPPIQLCSKFFEPLVIALSLLPLYGAFAHSHAIPSPYERATIGLQPRSPELIAPTLTHHEGEGLVGQGAVLGLTVPHTHLHRGILHPVPRGVRQLTHDPGGDISHLKISPSLFWKRINAGDEQTAADARNVYAIREPWQSTDQHSGGLLYHVPIFLTHRVQIKT